MQADTSSPSVAPPHLQPTNTNSPQRIPHAPIRNQGPSDPERPEQKDKQNHPIINLTTKESESGKDSQPKEGTPAESQKPGFPPGFSQPPVPLHYGMQPQNIPPELMQQYLYMNAERMKAHEKYAGKHPQHSPSIPNSPTPLQNRVPGDQQRKKDLPVTHSPSSSSNREGPSPHSGTRDLPSPHSSRGEHLPPPPPHPRMDPAMAARFNAYSQNFYLEQQRQHMMSRSPHDKKPTVASPLASPSASSSASRGEDHRSASVRSTSPPPARSRPVSSPSNAPPSLPPRTTQPPIPGASAPAGLPGYPVPFLPGMPAIPGLPPTAQAYTELMYQQQQQYAAAMDAAARQDAARRAAAAMQHPSSTSASSSSVSNAISTPSRHPFQPPHHPFYPPGKRIHNGD